MSWPAVIVVSALNRLAASAAASRLDALERDGILERGRGTYGTPDVLIWRRPGRNGFHGGRVRIGAYVSIADGVRVFTGGNHRVDFVSTYPIRIMMGLPGAHDDGHPASRGDVVIGNDVWLGHGATIMSGVQIGDGAVIGAGAVVTHDVRPYAIAVGSPAREVRRRFGDDQIAALLKIAWWNWPEDEIAANIRFLNGATVEEFIAAFDGGPERGGSA